MQSVYVIGGSNSLLRDGWVDQLVKLAPEFEVVNRSIGAATSLIGIYRILQNEVPDGATVVWEYALNEHNHFQSGQSIESLIYHLDWFLELCARRSIAVLPLVFWNRDEMADTSPAEYRDALRSCLSRQGLEQIDMKPILRQFSVRREKPIERLYENRAHYRIGSGVPRRIATAVKNRIGEARIPTGVPALQGRSLSIHRPDGLPDEHFSNRVLQTELYALDGPIQIKASGTPLCCFLMSGDAGRPITVAADGAPIDDFSTRFPPGKTKLTRLMKHLVLWSKEADRRVMRQGMTISRSSADQVRVQNAFVPPAPKMEGEREKYIGILVEQ